METLTAFVLDLEKFMYGEWFVITLLGTGLLLSFRTGFVQFRKMGAAWEMIF